MGPQYCCLISNQHNGFQDIKEISNLRVCCNGKWFVIEEVSNVAISKMLVKATTNDVSKT